MIRPIRLTYLAVAAVALLCAITATSAFASPPTISAVKAALNTTTSATLSATIDTSGHPGSAGIEYGTTEAYENLAAGEGIEEGSEPVHLSGTVNGLSRGTTYYYRVRAVNWDTLEVSEVKGTFKTRGLYMTGSGTETDKARLASTEALGAFNTQLPTYIPAEQTFTVLEASGITIKCAGSTLVSTPGVAGQIWAGIFANGTFTECIKINGIKPTVNMNGCYYRFYVSNTAAPYTGTLGKIGCPSEHKIEISAPGCTLKVAPQEITTSAITYSDSNYAGEKGAVQIGVNEAKGIVFEKIPPETGSNLCGLIFGKAHMSGNLLVTVS